MTARALTSVLLLLAVLGVAGWQLSGLLADPTVWPPDDYVEYWAAGRLNLDGTNPYLKANLWPLQTAAGRKLDTVDDAVMMWNPPWTLTAVMPLGTLPSRVGQFAWLFVGVAAVGLSAWLFWKRYGGNSDKPWVAFAVGFAFLPTLFGLQVGQISGLMLLGVALFGYFLYTGKPFAAGAAAVLIAVKPHLVYLLWPAILIDAIAYNRWRVILGGIVVAAVAIAIPMAFNPDVWAHYFNAYKVHPPAEHVSLTIGILLRVLFGQELFWLQFLPMSLGFAWFAWHRWTFRDGWSVSEYLPMLVLVSFVTAPYGAWHFDLVLLLVPLIQRAAEFSQRPWDQRASAATFAFLGMNVVMALMCVVGVWSWHFAWVAPVVFVGYAWTGHKSSQGVALGCAVPVLRTEEPRPVVKRTATT